MNTRLSVKISLISVMVTRHLQNCCHRADTESQGKKIYSLS